MCKATGLLIHIEHHDSTNLKSVTILVRYYG